MQRAAPGTDSGTDGHEGPYGAERVSKLSAGTVRPHEHIHVLCCV